MERRQFLENGTIAALLASAARLRAVLREVSPMVIRLLSVSIR